MKSKDFTVITDKYAKPYYFLHLEEVKDVSSFILHLGFRHVIRQIKENFQEKIFYPVIGENKLSLLWANICNCHRCARATLFFISAIAIPQLKVSTSATAYPQLLVLHCNYIFALPRSSAEVQTRKNCRSALVDFLNWNSATVRLIRWEPKLYAWVEPDPDPLFCWNLKPAPLQQIIWDPAARSCGVRS